MPLVGKGCVGNAAWQTAAACTDVAPTIYPTKNYYVSVAPRSGASIGGATYVPGVGAIIYVNEYPIPTAQISVWIFEDNNPINNAPDVPQEDAALNGGDMSGFSIILEDAGGHYGASAGTQTTDVFGNLLGTTYQVGVNGNPVLDVDGSPIVTGYQPLVTGPDGHITIKNLAPGKYGISAVPPNNQGWVQTTTIVGTKVIDAWFKPNEPPFVVEFGPALVHVFIGFVKEQNNIPATVPPSTTTVTGTVVNQHVSRPPDVAFYNGNCFGHTTPWIGLNDMAVGLGTGIYAKPTDGNCNFSIPNVPDGTYQLVIWDSNLDLIINFQILTVSGGTCNRLAIFALNRDFI